MQNDTISVINSLFDNPIINTFFTSNLLKKVDITLKSKNSNIKSLYLPDD